VSLVSWLGARKVLVPDGEAVTLGVTDGAAAEEAGALGGPTALGDPTGTGDPAGVLAELAAVELADEPQAVTSMAAQARPAQPSPARERTARERTVSAAVGRDFRDFVVNIVACPFNFPIAAR
jgi:hypothetical protein